MIFQIKLRKNLWNHQERKSQLILRCSSLASFLTAWILWGMDFTNKKQYCPSSWFQLSWIAFDRSAFHYKFTIGLRSGLFAGRVVELICLSWRKASILFALWQDALSSWKMSSSSQNIFPSVTWETSKISVSSVFRSFHRSFTVCFPL